MNEAIGTPPVYPQQQPAATVPQGMPASTQLAGEVSDQMQTPVQDSTMVQPSNGSFFSTMNMIKVGVLIALIGVIAFALWSIFVPAYEIHVSNQPFNPEGIRVDKVVVRRNERIMVVMFSASNLLPGVPISYSSTAGRGTYEDLFFPIRFDEEAGPPAEDLLPKQGDTVFLAIVRDTSAEDGVVDTQRNILTDFFGNPYMVSIKLE